MYSSPIRHAPPGYMQFDYQTSPATAPYYPPKTYYTATPTQDQRRPHTRHTSHAPSSYAYATPSQQRYFQPAADYNSGYYTNAIYTSSKSAEHVSNTERIRVKTRESTTRETTKPKRSSSIKKQTPISRPQTDHHVYVVDDDDEGYYSPSKASPPPPYQKAFHNDGYWVADQYQYDQIPTLKHSSTEPPKYKSSPAAATTPRKRSASFSTKPTNAIPTRARATSGVKTPPKASAADAAAAGIPAGYSYKNWDPTEEPILLLGSVFDANSLGKWIYDWTVFHHGPVTPMSDLAGDLWLLLIQLAGKIKRAEECIPRIRRVEDRDLVEDFLESGERLWNRFSKILKVCEEYMWRAAKKESTGRKTPAVAMGAKSGCEFVDSIFGRDRRLEDTEKLMTGMRLWSMRFDANCENILRRPSV